MKRINTRLKKLKVVTVLIAMWGTPGFAQPAKPSSTPTVAAMDAVLKRTPDDESAHYYRAVALQTAGDYQKAKVDYQWVTSHAKNQVLVRYAEQALKNLSASSAFRGSQAGALEGRALQYSQRPVMQLPPGSLPPGGGGKYAIMRQPAGQ